MNMTLRMEQWTPEKWQSEIDRMAGQSLDEERQEMISQIYGLSLRIKLDQLGETYTMEADDKFITVNINLKPDRCLHFCVRSEKAPEMADKIEGLIAAANTLNQEFWDTGMRIE